MEPKELFEYRLKHIQVLLEKSRELGKELEAVFAEDFRSNLNLLEHIRRWKSDILLYEEIIKGELKKKQEQQDEYIRKCKEDLRLCNIANSELRKHKMEQDAEYIRKCKEDLRFYEETTRTELKNLKGK